MSEFNVNSIMLVGCGGTGSILAPHLARLALYHEAVTDQAELYLVDGDNYEEKNLNRQHFCEASIELNKALSTHLMIRDMGLSNTTYIDDYLSAFTFRKYLNGLNKESGFPIVIAAVDNDGTRAMILKALAKTDNYVFISPANSSLPTPPRGHVMWTGQLNGERIGCDLLNAYPNFIRPADVIPTKGGCIEAAPSEPQLISCNFMAAAFTLSLIQNILDQTLDTQHHAVHFSIRNLTALAT